MVHPRWGQSDRSSATAVLAGFFDGLLDRFAGFTRALLDSADQFVLFAFGVLEILICELGHFCFNLPLVMFQSPLISSVVMMICVTV